MGMTNNPLKSLKCDVESHAVFTSRTRRKTAVYWISYEGCRVRYGVINYGQSFQIMTFETHPWVFRDAETGDKLVTSDQLEVYWPKPWNGVVADTVIIGIPMYSLRERSMQVVRQLLNPDEISTSDLPADLKRDLMVDRDTAPFQTYQPDDQ